MDLLQALGSGPSTLQQHCGVRRGHNLGRSGGVEHFHRLGDGSADAIYLGEEIINRDGRTAGHPGATDRHISNVEFRNPTCDEAMGGQIGSDPGRGAALESRGARSRVPGNRDLREAFEGEGETETGLWEP